MIALLTQTVLISLSGVMAPGPVTALTIAHGTKNRWAGVLVACGHGAVEIPLIALLILGFGRVLQGPSAQAVIALCGGLFLLYMAVQMLLLSHRGDTPRATSTYGPFMTGVISSATNPYFLVWWAMVGMTLISRARLFGAGGVLLFSLVHWSCDLVWLGILSLSAGAGVRLMGPRFTRAIMLICALFLFYFGGAFVVDGVGRLGSMTGTGKGEVTACTSMARWDTCNRRAPVNFLKNSPHALVKGAWN